MSTFCFYIDPCSQNSAKFRFTIIQVLCSNLFASGTFLQSGSTDILVLCETNLKDAIVCSNFSVRDYLPLSQKDSASHLHGLTVYVKKRTSFCMLDIP